ncbi:MAG TPA: hypothetical protein VHD32_04420 [Candidatus Didemnitutus sp.]|nr:hypothetical protein [Candidatus Didemnitutus sp.]
MSTENKAWHKLVIAARSVPSHDEAAPYGFATRVATMGLSVPLTPRWALFEKFAIRGLIAACACGAAAAAFGYSSWTGDHENENGTDEGAMEVFDLSS